MSSVVYLDDVDAPALLDFASPSRILSAVDHSILPCPSGPLIRQRALGANSRWEREIVWSDTTPDYYGDVSFDEPIMIFDLPVVLYALKNNLPSDIKPHVKYSQRTDGHGLTFTFILCPVTNAPSPGIMRLSQLAIDEDLAWEYVACDYIRHRYMGREPFRLRSVSRPQFNAFLETSRLHAALHDALAQQILN